MTTLFSLQQQAIVAESRSEVVWVDIKSGRLIDIRTVSDNWERLYQTFAELTERSQKAKE